MRPSLARSGDGRLTVRLMSTTQSYLGTKNPPGVIQSHFIMQASLSPLHTVTLWSDSPQQIPLIISFSTVSPVKNALSLNSDAEQNRRRGKKKNPSRSLFGYLKEWSYLLYSRNHIVFIEECAWHPLPCPYRTATFKMPDSVYILKKTNKKTLHSGLPEEAQNSSQLLPLLPSFLSTPHTPLALFLSAASFVLLSKG